MAPQLSAATPGSIDPTFDPGAGIAPMGSLPVRAIYPLADGSFLLGGYFTNYNGVPRPALAKILENGALDETFTPDPSFVPHVTEVWSISQQPDGKFIVSGINGSPSKAMIVRLNTDGSLDPSFVFPQRLAHFGMAVHARADGLIAYLTEDNPGIGLLNSDGSRLLTSGGPMPFSLFARIRTSPEGNTYYCFNSGLFSFGGAFGSPDDALFISGGATTYDFDLQSDGRVVCGGPSTSNALRRYFPNGVLDSAFKAKIAATDLDAIVVQPDDKVLISGTFSTTVNGVTLRNLARLNADGSFDTNFVTGAGPNSSVISIALVGNGKALIAGQFTSYDGLSRTGLARIFLDPPALPRFITQPRSTNLVQGQSLRLAVAVTVASPVMYQWKRNGDLLPNRTNQVLFLEHAQPDDAGTYTVEVTSRDGSSTSDEAIVGVASAPTGPGSLDITFANDEAANRTVNAFIALPDGRSLIGGNFFSYDGQLQYGLARLNGDGSLDSSFNLNIPSYVTVTTFARQPDGKILVGFNFLRSGGIPAFPLVMRLNSDGSADASFLSSVSRDISAIAPLPDGKVLIGGAFSSLGGQSGLARVNMDGSIDPTFDTTALQLSKVYALAVQADGEILVGAPTHVLRLKPDASVDVDVPLVATVGLGLRTLVLQSDGKILVGGGFTSIAGVSRTNVARLNADMTVDPDFAVIAGAAPANLSAVFSLALQSDQKILLGGTFFDLGGVACTNIGRLMPNGAVDTTFNANAVLAAPSNKAVVNSIAIDGESTVTVGGTFSTVNGVTRNSLARLFWAAPPLRVTAAPTLSSGQLTGITISVPPDPSSDFILQFSDTLPPTWQDLLGFPPGSSSITQPFTGSQRFFRIQQRPR